MKDLIPSDLGGNPNCTRCDLHRTAEHVCLMGRGPDPCEVMIVGEAPGVREDDVGKPFQGKAGELLEELMAECGIGRPDVYITNANKCRPPNNRTPSAKEIKACRPYLEQEIDAVNPKYVLVLGAVALKSLLNRSGITTIHGGWIEKDGVLYMPTFHPAAALRDPKRMDPIKQDFKKFFNRVNGVEEEATHSLNYTLVKDKESLRDCIDTIRKTKTVAFDIETTGLDRFDSEGRINILTLATAKREFVIPLQLPGYDWLTFSGMVKLIQLIAKILKNKRTVAHNGKFDNLWLLKKFGVKFKLTFDTILASHLLDENTPNDLEYLSRHLLGAEDYDIPLEVKQGKVPERYEELIEYAGFDGYYTLKLYYLFSKQLKADQYLNKLFYTLVMPVARTYEVVENNGVYIDIPMLNKVKKYLRRQIRKTQIELNKFITDEIIEEVASKPKKGEKKAINWNSSPQVGKILFDHFDLTPQGYTPKGAPSSAEDFLQRMINDHPIIKPLLDYRGYFKLYSSFVKGWELRMHDGVWLHPTFKVYGTVTGRPSCSDPNLQQVPRDPQIRQLIGAPDGWVFFEADYSQIELRIAALIADEPTMLRIFYTGGDIHRATASAVSGLSEEEISAEQRKKAKAVNFGFIYGMGWLKFMDYALDKYGVKLIEREAKSFRRRFFEKYNRLPRWHDRQRNLVATLGHVRTLTGRIRHLPEIYSSDKGLRAQAERNAINSPVQGFAAELTLMGLVAVTERFDSNTVRTCGTVHDALVGRVRVMPNGEHYKVLYEIKKIMEHPPILDELGIELDVPIEVDVKVGNWGIGKELDFSEHLH